MPSEYTYPLLTEITQIYKSHQKSFDHIYVLACQHILEPQARMFELLSNFGIPKQNIFIFGKIYSTSNEVVNELRRDNFKIAEPTFNPSISFDAEHKQNCENELKLFLSSIQSPSKIIILDDGGGLLKIVNDSFSVLPTGVPVIGIEQTSSGFRKLEHTDLHFPVFNVARSAIKLIKESPLIAGLGCRRIEDVIKQYSVLEPRILVVGLGPIGSNTLSILNEKEYFTLGYDIAHHDKQELIDLIKNNNINIVIGVTGINILNEQQLQQIKESISHDLYLISMSSADREFPASYIRNNGISPEKIHGDAIWDNLILINNGFPITFKGLRHESTPEEIERTIGLLYGSTLEAATKEVSATGFIEVPTVVTNILEKRE